jgi:integrase
VELDSFHPLRLRATRSARRVLAKVKDVHSHRFRDTFAVSLLENGVSIENVTVLLGHSSVRITERHYKPWVKTLHKKLEDEVRKAWG